MTSSLRAGAAAIDITPKWPMFLHGYPRVSRTSTGVHDPLLASALFLTDGSTPVIFVGCDVIFVGREICREARERITEATGVPTGNILISATHTHSGPVIIDMVCSSADPVVPKADPKYIRQLVDGIVDAAIRAHRTATVAEIGLVTADGSCVGTNRHDPAGPRNAEVPVLAVRDRQTLMPIGVMVICSMHPTVLHEDSTLFSGDFPGLTRRYLQSRLVGVDTPVIYHSGPCGNQSPRHVTKSNTFAEATRLGNALGKSIEDSLVSITYLDRVEISCDRIFVDLPLRSFPSPESAEKLLYAKTERYELLKHSGAKSTEVRTAECDCFGAEETVTFARAAADGKLEALAAELMPAEIMRVQLGPWTFIGWSGEVFVEFGLAIKKKYPNSYLITLANGEFQGYLVTQEARDRATYESLNAMFASPESGDLLVERTLEMLGT